MSKLIMPSILRPPQYGFRDRSLEWSGASNQYLNVNNRVVDTQSFSVESMVRPNISGMGSAQGAIIHERGAANSGQYNYMLIWHNGGANFRLYIRVGSTTYIAESTTIPTTGTWYHVAGVCDADNGELKIYVDGVEEDNVSWSGTRNILNTNLRVGISGWTFSLSTRYAGRLSDIRVWDHARTPEQIKRYSKVPLRGSETGLLAYYPINEGSGSNTEDKTGNGNDLSLVNNPTWIT